MKLELTLHLNVRFLNPLAVKVETATPADITGINRKLDNIMATITERLKAVETAIDDASAEIVAEIAKLKDENLSPEGEATLARLEAKVTALKDIVPDAPPADE